MIEHKRVKAVLGIDITKAKFNVAFLRSDKYKHKSFSNNSNGFSKLSKWLERQSVEELHAELVEGCPLRPGESRLVIRACRLQSETALKRTDSRVIGTRPINTKS